MMDLLWIIVGFIFLIVGIVGCFLPILPGPPISYVGLLVLQLKEIPPFTYEFMMTWFVITIAVTALDYIVPVYGTKKLGGSKKGVWGSMIGLVAGVIFFPPFGIILGPLLGALIGELLDGKDSGAAVKAALGSFLGFLAGTLLKLIACLVMGYYFIMSLF